MSTTMTPRAADTAFRHEALLYAGEAEFLDRTLPFIRRGLGAGEATLVVVDARKIGRLRAALGDDAERVHFADMDVLGHNPARIIPAWRAFVDEHRGTGRPMRGIGEPVSATRRPAALAECQRHESLLNVAFEDAPAWWLLCPYDTVTLDVGIIDEARRSHPFVWQGGERRASPACRDLAAMAAPVTAPLAEPDVSCRTFSFDGLSSLPLVRSFVADVAGAGGLGTVPTVELVGAVHELAANSVRHGGGEGVLRGWVDEHDVICEVRDRGYLDEPLAGRESPALDADGGRGLWLANQFCDLMQIRASDAGTVIRVHKTRATPTTIS
jgi:anti-sigma regulatory factor (Ser/Thr protein kinase)